MRKAPTAAALILSILRSTKGHASIPELIIQTGKVQNTIRIQMDYLLSSKQVVIDGTSRTGARLFCLPEYKK